jgi:hypothetical protein
MLKEQRQRNPYQQIPRLSLPNPMALTEITKLLYVISPDVCTPLKPQSPTTKFHVHLALTQRRNAQTTQITVPAARWQNTM